MPESRDKQHRRADAGVDAGPLVHQAQVPGKRTLAEAQSGGGLRIQRKPANGGAGHRAEQQADAAAARVTAESTASVLVDDNASGAKGQMAKREFIALLKPQLEAAATEELGPQWSAAGCPYIVYYVQVYAGRSARDCEMFIRKFTGSRATTAHALIADMLARVGEGVRTWRTTGQVSPEIAATAAAQGAPVAPSMPPSAFSAASGGPTIQRKAKPGGSQSNEPTDSPAHVLDQLGDGAALDSSTQSRMGSAFGASFADVRVHADGRGNALASQQGALAFTVGSHVAFAAGRYVPGTVEGDALLAHELTHVLQQRGASRTAPQHKTGGSQSGDAERDADRGAVAAVQHLHGQDKSTRASASRSTDLQLQRCEGTANEGEGAMLGTTGQFHQNVYSWDGDPFAVRLRYDQGKPIGGGLPPANLMFEAKYAGADDCDVAISSLMFPMVVAKPIRPQLKFDKSDGWAQVVIDLHGDGSWIGTVRHATTFYDGWSPKTRLHTFSGMAGSQAAVGGHPVMVKSKNALHAADASAGKPAAGNSVAHDGKSVSVDLAVTVAKRNLDAVLGDPALGLDAKAAPWASLKPKVDADAAKYSASTTVADPAEAERLRRLGDALLESRPMLVALGAASKREAYLPDIADRCIAMVVEVRRQYEAAIGASWDDDASGRLRAAHQAFDALWYRITTLYLQEDGGAGAMLTAAENEAQNVLAIRGKAPAVGFPKLEHALGVPSAVVTAGRGGSDPSLISRARQRMAEVRAEFMAGKSGSLAKASALVGDVQVATGLASILVLAQTFRNMKAEMHGVVGGAADTVGRDLSAVCDGYAHQLDGFAASVEATLPAPLDQVPTLGRPAVDQLQALCNSAQFKKDIEAIKSRLKTIAVIETLGKVLAIIGVAALTGGAAGAAVGGALEGASATAGVAAAGEFAAEVVTFTVVSRIGNQVAFGKNETGLAEDLVTNAIMLGSLKAAAAAYGRVFKIIADPKVYKTTYAAGGAVTGMVALQAFAEAHYALKNRKMMDGDERLRSLVSSGVMLAALSLGGFLAKPLHQRIRGEVLLKVAGPRLAAIEDQLAGLKTQVDALKTDPKGPDHAAELLKRIESLWNEELKQLGEAAKAEKDNPAQAAQEFKAVVDTYRAQVAKLDLQLAQSGLDVNLGDNKAGNLFRPVRPGYVAYRAEGLPILKDYYASDGGTLELLKDGEYAGKSKSGDETYYVSEDKAPDVFKEQRPRAPTEAEAAANRAQAEAARESLKARADKLKALVMARVVDGHLPVKLDRVIAGTGLAAAIDANTLPGAQRGSTPAPLTDLPQTIGVGTGPDTFSKLGDMSIGQAATELDGSGWAKQPSEFTADHGNYTTARTIADATSVTQLQSGVAILDSSALEVSTQHDTTWKVPDAKVRIKVKITGGSEVYLYADFTDLATGLGESSGRLIYGDQPAQQRGGRVMVSGGSATAAWNAKTAADLGAEVDWSAEDRTPNKDPQQLDSKRRYERVQKMLDAGELTPDQAQAELAQIRAFDASALPRNVQAADAAFNNPKIHRSVRGIQSMTPTEKVPGAPPGNVRVTFTDASAPEIYDQVVESHATDIAAGSDPGPAGAVKLADGIKMRPVVRGSKVIALESIDPPGAVRVIGAAMWTVAWGKWIPDDINIPDPMDPTSELSMREVFMNALANQAKGGPRDSPASPLIHHVAGQVPAANQ